MKRILFVDDEQKILEGLRRLLRPQKAQWEMVFCTSGQAALEELKKQPFDVVVSDMRMPGMDGVALLKEVQARHPNVVRIVLSGYTEWEATLRTVSVAHQFLSKPCDAGVLKDVVERACSLTALLRDEGLRRVVGEISNLPLQPKTYTRLIQALADPEVSMANISRLVEQDVALCSKILHIVNSSFFGLSRNMTNIAQAVTFLGTSTLKGLALLVEAFSSVEAARQIPGFSLQSLHEHSILTANIARKLLADRHQADDAFVAGLLHDVGKLILVSRMPDRFKEILHSTQASRRPMHVVEKDFCAVTHAEIGAFLLGLWGLPWPVVEAVAHHHAPWRVSQRCFDVLSAVHISNILAREQLKSSGDWPVEAIDLKYLESLGVGDQLARWRELAADTAKREVVKA